MIQKKYLKFFAYILALTSTQVRATLKEDILKAAQQEKYDFQYFLEDDDPEVFDIFVDDLMRQSTQRAQIKNHGLSLLLNIYETQKNLKELLQKIVDLVLKKELKTREIPDENAPQEKWNDWVNSIGLQNVQRARIGKDELNQALEEYNEKKEDLQKLEEYRVNDQKANDQKANDQKANDQELKNRKTKIIQKKRKN
jgi:hypothetical protein